MARIQHHPIIMTGSNYFLYFLFALVTTTVVQASTEVEFIQSQFYPSEPPCQVADRIATGCSRQVPYMRNPTECIMVCNQELGCIGASLDDNGACYNHFPCPMVNNTCSFATQGHVYMSKNCDNSGQFNPISRYCDCVIGWLGPTCQERPRDCVDLIYNGYSQGTYRVYLDPYRDGTNLITAHCSIIPETFYSAVLLGMHEGNIDFNLTMAFFEDGFYIDDRNFFVGLKSWHALSNMGYNLVFFSFGFGEEGSLYRYYKDFYLRDASKKFSFHHGQTHENGSGDILSTENRVGDCFGPLQFQAFYTWDNDNANSCAAQTGSGWWHTAQCSDNCNLFSWGRGHQSAAGTPPQQQVSVPGVNPELVSTKLEFVAILAEKQ